MSQADRNLDRQRGACVALLLVFAAAFNFQAFRAYVFEDAYITFRYAANLAAGHGFVFQPGGDPVLGTSTPLFTLVLALAGILGVDIPTAGRLISTTALSAAGAFGYLLLARRGSPNAGAFFAVAAASGAGSILVYSGMETSLHVALILLAAYLASEERPLATGIVLGLLCLNRYDGVMAVAAVLLTRYLKTRRLPLREAFISGGIFGAWLLFAQLYFGHFLPNTYAAKVADQGFVAYLLGSLEVQGKTLLKPLYRLQLPLRLWPSTWLIVSLLIVVPLLAWALRAIWKARYSPENRAGSGNQAFELAPLGFTAFFLWIGYSFIGPPLEHHWYLIPATYCLLVLALAAWSDGLALIPQRVAVFAAVLTLLATIFSLPWALRKEIGSLTSVAFSYDRIEAYEAMADWLHHHHLEGTTILTREPGYLSYQTGQQVIDAAGLVTPSIYFHGPKERRSDLFDLLETRRPEFAVLGSPVLHQPQMRSPSYQLAMSAVPSRNLWIRRDFFRQHLDELYESWQHLTYAGAGPATLRHPLSIDFGTTRNPPFHIARNCYIGRVPGLTFPANMATQEGMVLTSQGRKGPSAAWSQTFDIDFDELDFLFFATHEFLTTAQLFVDGLLVYEVVGREQPAGLAGPGPLEEVEIPVYAWRGRRGKLYLVSAEGNKDFFAADRIRSKRFTRSRSFDDFETGAYAPSIWQQGFGAAPTSTRLLADLGGLELVQGRHAASSLFFEGKQQMVSQPFRVDFDFLSFTVFDFGDQRTRVELRVAGERRHLYTGSGKRRVDLVKWDLRHLRGQEAVLIVRDDIASAEEGIGIDSILSFDE